MVLMVGVLRNEFFLPVYTAGLLQTEDVDLAVQQIGNDVVFLEI